MQRTLLQESRTYRFLFVSLLLVVFVSLDQWTKSIARTSLASGDPVLLLGGMIRLQYAQNTGAFLSLGSGLPSQLRFILFVIFVAAALAATFVFGVAARKVTMVQLTSLALISAGGTGNLIDRIANQGTVADFMNLGIGSVRTGIFNVADLCIVAGIVIFVLFRG